MLHIHKHNIVCCAGLALFAPMLSAEPAMPALAMEEVRVWGERGDGQNTPTSGPSSVITPDDVKAINIATTEDLVKFEPSLVIRRRFIGDANGTLGMRGSNMFQTARSMVFADGVPLHYLLESRWSGAPRWTLVSASEIAQVELLYGPFSAEYSGNSMGGVINIETAIPEGRRIHMDGSFFSQDFDAYGFDDTINGYKGFASYGDRFGDLSVYLSYNHLDNEAQPQSYYYGGKTDAANPTPVSGAIPGLDKEGSPRLYFGDTGMVNTTTDNIKLKLGYDWKRWSTLVNIAYEDRLSRSDDANSYVTGPVGEFVWGGAVTQDGTAFSMPASRLNVSTMERDTLSTGWRIRGELAEGVSLETSLSHFTIIRDESRESAVNPAHPDASPTGQVSDYGDTGWQTAEVKLHAEDWLTEGLSLVTGARTEAYELNLNIYDSDDYRNGEKTAAVGRSGGETRIDALYAQAAWQFHPQWDTTLGLRYEDWQSNNGYFSNDQPGTPELDLTPVPGNDRQHISPKFSLGFAPNSEWQWRYSLAQAYRFPIVEELFSQYRAYNAVSQANPELKPEDGVHQNLMLERELDHGVMRFNLFQETIDDVIESQTDLLPGGGSVRTFVPVDEVTTWGAEWIANLQGLWHPQLDLRFNLTYTRSEITENDPNPDLEGNTFPRMPRWRGNLLTTYHLTPKWDLSASLQYASDSYGNLDNSDTEDEVYGAQDGYAFIGLKTRYQFDDRWGFSLGVDNITDQRAYVAHPWPGRTVYANFSYDWQ
ncbi:TonB-dependent receptor [Marinimicrobium agarilyticum]|uniref:TonB-dependent receptor n=1 Tax=Marinimicrobium agarilyticum TaxID=306546 RepID=UPI0003FC61FB|nr:TonB-dependent receptor [Marinimicrobium agarilyticum]